MGTQLWNGRDPMSSGSDNANNVVYDKPDGQATTVKDELDELNSNLANGKFEVVFDEKGNAQYRNIVTGEFVNFSGGEPTLIWSNNSPTHGSQDNVNLFTGDLSEYDYFLVEAKAYEDTDTRSTWLIPKDGIMHICATVRSNGGLVSRGITINNDSIYSTNRGDSYATLFTFIKGVKANYTPLDTTPLKNRKVVIMLQDNTTGGMWKYYDGRLENVTTSYTSTEVSSTYDGTRTVTVNKPCKGLIYDGTDETWKTVEYEANTLIWSQWYTVPFISILQMD